MLIIKADCILVPVEYRQFHSAAAGFLSNSGQPCEKHPSDPAAAGSDGCFSQGWPELLRKPAAAEWNWRYSTGTRMQSAFMISMADHRSMTGLTIDLAWKKLPESHHTAQARTLNDGFQWQRAIRRRAKSV